ncbi:hypothetical protein THAOC_07609 [Thalassiosira oceanica]|uniref:Thioredoxin domain-containing protein n=1 Tax=Thalassiosira oceanica TaxID=159749 RepID=K0T1B5_THAOC|nr:hypothetical protein THAOC_07609 [Thalassiosira oceanica]|eukprot:EJK70989.1 hypothetical protein THAOC_07609 [Thalassiosira oceanica]
MFVPFACSVVAFVSSSTSTTRVKMTQCSASAAAALQSLPSLLDSKGGELTLSATKSKLHGKRVALFFSAGWCPMCTSFEPALLQFREAATASSKDVEIIYVPSDRSETDLLKRTEAMDMLSVRIGEEADALKKRFCVWAGSECVKLGSGRRSGVPALVVLDGKCGEELAFLPAESQGAKSLQSWPLENADGIW